MYIIDNNVRKRLKYPVQCFVYYMNDMAKKLFLMRTHYANPHGLANNYNVSTAEDQAFLCKQVILNKLFRQIVNTKEYKCEIKNKS